MAEESEEWGEGVKVGTPELCCVRVTRIVLYSYM